MYSADPSGKLINCVLGTRVRVPGYPHDLVLLVKNDEYGFLWLTAEAKENGKPWIMMYGLFSKVEVLK